MKAVDMGKSDQPQKGEPKTIPLLLAYVLFALTWGVIPSAISFLSPRLGWADGRPGIWNLLGVVPLLAGLAGSLWTLSVHSEQSNGALDWEADKSYLLTRGPYAVSRNPMYVSELTLILGWAIFYGSVSVLIAFLVWWAWFYFFQVPQEERTIEARFGQAYVAYKSKVPRWIGKPRQ